MHEQFKNEFPKFYQQLQEGRGELIEEVLPGASEADLEKLEQSLGLPFPESYKRLLRCSRGFWLFGGVVQLSSGHPFFHQFSKVTGKTRGGTWPPASDGMLCFAEFFMEADGDQVLFDVSNGLINGEYPVMYYAHDEPNELRKLADSFEQWLNEFLDYPEWN
jgi:hypothetical protein